MLAAACSPLKTFDTVIPKDSGSLRAASAIAYGEGPRRKLDVYIPRRGQPDAKARALPVVVFFYGGSWSSGTRTGYSFVGRALAAQGIIAIIPDYRLVPEVRYPGFVEDGAAAVRWARDHAAEFGGDPDRIVVAGHSAGAYIAAMLAFDPRWLGAAQKQLKGFVGLAGPYDFAPFHVPASRQAFGQWPDATETQPVRWASAGDPPALLLHGAADRTVRLRNSESLAVRLRAAGVPVKLKLYPRVGHVGIATAIARPFRNKAPVVQDIASFVEQVTD